MTTKKIIPVYIIFVFLLMSFTGCGRLKDSSASGLNQTETPAPSKVNNQPEAPAPLASPLLSSASDGETEIKSNYNWLKYPLIAGAVALILVGSYYGYYKWISIPFEANYSMPTFETNYPKFEADYQNSLNDILTGKLTTDFHSHLNPFGKRIINMRDLWKSADGKTKRIMEQKFTYIWEQIKENIGDPAYTRLLSHYFKKIVL
jgi:hypothetical protein